MSCCLKSSLVRAHLPKTILFNNSITPTANAQASIIFVVVISPGTTARKFNGKYTAAVIGTTTKETIYNTLSAITLTVSSVANFFTFSPKFTKPLYTT